jgi:hypothetical protein
MFKVQTELLVILDLSQKHKTNKCANFTCKCVIADVSGGLCLGSIAFQIMTILHCCKSCHAASSSQAIADTGLGEVF